MRVHHRLLPLLTLTLSIALSAGAAQAQRIDNRALVERLEALERNFTVMQRQVANGEEITTTGGNIPSDVNVARMDARLAAMEEQIRNLKGTIEEQDFKNRKLSEQIEKLSKDVDFRFNNMAQAPAAHTTEEAETATEPEEETTTENVEVKPAATTAPTFNTPREHYNYAFKLLNQAKYTEAAESFESFLSTYPKDPLAGNAFYWLGESYYVRRDYVKAADYFRQGFEALPKGPKAADNLLKLAMSLTALKQTKESCVVLNQLIVKFGDSSQTVRDKAQSEQKRIGCQ